MATVVAVGFAVCLAPAPHAVTALSSGYSTGFLIVAIAALVCAVATALFLGGRTEQEQEIEMIEHGEDARVA